MSVGRARVLFPVVHSCAAEELALGAVCSHPRAAWEGAWSVGLGSGRVVIWFLLKF